jgi:asparagine synthase (glutamine-hydrolysing)
LAAEANGCPLVEREYDVNIRLADMLSFKRTVNPWLYFTRLERDKLEAQLANSLGASIITCGSFGDILFQQSSTSHAAGEFLRWRGMGPRFFRVAMDAAELDNLSVWTVMARALREQLIRHRTGPWCPPHLTSNEFRRHWVVTDDVADEFVRKASRFIHPWLREPGAVAEGKLSQISALCMDTYCYDPLAEDSDPARIAPLASQPLAELCSRIPTYVLVHNGWTRALARRAFAQDLPPAIRTRTGKGSPRAFPAVVLHENREFVRDMLLNGILVQRGILDKRKIAAGLPGTLAKAPMYVGDLVGHLCAETWLRVSGESARRQVLAA